MTLETSPYNRDYQAADAPSGEPRPLSVSQLNAAVRACLEHNFPRVWVAGELAEISLHPSGHVYFTLKDPQTGAQVKGVAFRYLKKAQEAQLAKGVAVQVYGTVSLFEQHGAFQVYATSILPSGLGELNRKLEELKAKLAGEGLFDPTRKRPIPPLPRTIGLVTAPNGAAIQDFLRNVQSPYGGLHVRFIPSAVQGNDAVRQLTASIRYLNQTHACDVIVVTRGGGGQEDLAVFNDETLVRAIAASELPLISAVGHDRDLSLCDLAADMAVSTPTAAANLVVRGKLELCTRLDTAYARMLQTSQRQLLALSQRYGHAAACPFLNHPMDWLNRLAQRQDYASGRLLAALPNLATRQKARLDNARLSLIALRHQLLTNSRKRLQDATARLETQSQTLLQAPVSRFQRCSSMLAALNPKAVLTRGYAILLKENGQAVRKPEDAQPEETLNALLAQGEIKLKVVKPTP